MKRYRIVDAHGVTVENLEANSMMELHALLKQQRVKWLKLAYPDMGTERDPGVAVERFRREHGRLPGEGRRIMIQPFTLEGYKPRAGDVLTRGNQSVVISYLHEANGVKRVQYQRYVDGRFVESCNRDIYTFLGLMPECQPETLERMVGVTDAK